MRIAIVGAGNISAQYVTSLARIENLELVAVADRFPAAAQTLADRLGIAALGVDELLARHDIELVVNLTIPAAHAEVSIAALEAGKHVYVEKPLAATVEQGRAVLAAARKAGLHVGSAPDTVLGTGVQTARSVVESGQAGRAFGATAFMTTPGHESWHPNPDFYYQQGGGPLFDMGPYYLTALHALLGPVARVVAASTRGTEERVIGRGDRAGQSIPVEIDTHVSASLQHASGAVTTMMMSFDTWSARLPSIEVYGTLGTVAVPDPNGFDGDVELHRSTTREWETVPVAGGYEGAGRGYGVSEMASAIREGRVPRQDGEIGLHILEIMEAITTAAATGESVTLETSPLARPAVPKGSVPW